MSHRGSRARNQMNQESESQQVVEAAADSKPDAGSEAKASQAEVDDARQKSRGGSSLPGWLALLIALLTAAGGGYLWTRQQAQQQTNNATDRLGAELRERVAEVERLEDKLDQLSNADSQLADDVSSLEQQLSSQRRQLDLMPARVERLERVLEALPGVADKARSAWLLAEAEYYLRIGNAQLGLARNADVALRALELADEKLRDVGDPGLLRVRRVLADEITALRAVPRPDAEGIALRIGSLSRSLVSLPLSRQTPEQYGRNESQDTTLSGWQRAWQAIKDALLSVVRIKRTDEVVAPLRTEIEESILLRGMETTLDVARLALIRGDARLYRDALAGVDERLQRHFDLQDRSVQVAREQLAELSGAQLPESLPDISASLNLLLRFGTDAPEL